MTSHVPRYHGYRFPPEIISHAVWLYHRFCLSFRDAEDLLAQRGITVTYETIRHWCQTFGPDDARRLRRRRGRMGDTWYLDELFVTIQGRRQYLWRAVDQDGDVLDILVQSRRDRWAATRFFRKLLNAQGRVPQRLITDKLLSYRAAHRTVMPSVVHSSGPQYQAVREQSSGGVSLVDPPTPGPDATVQVGRTRATLPVGARARAEPLSCRPTPATGWPLPRVQEALVRRVGCGDVHLLNHDGH